MTVRSPRFVTGVVSQSEFDKSRGKDCLYAVVDTHLDWLEPDGSITSNIVSTGSESEVTALCKLLNTSQENDNEAV